MTTANEVLNGSIPPAKLDYASDQEVRWCPGCGDYSILKQVETILKEQGKPEGGDRLHQRHRLQFALPVLPGHVRHAQHPWPRTRHRQRPARRAPRAQRVDDHR
jgi:hypothetical protein